MPSDTTPRMRAGFRGSLAPLWGLNSLAPGLAKHILCPASTLGAPHTTSTSSLPVVTRHSLRRSACGWGRMAVTRPTSRHSPQSPMR